MNVFNLIAGLASIIGLATGFYFFIKSRNEKVLSYAYNTTKFVDDIPGDKRLRLTFEGREIDRLSFTKIAVWNSGSTVIEEGDFARKKPLSIAIQGEVEELETYSLYKSDVTNNIRFMRSGMQEIRPLFDYLGPREGFILMVLHEGDEFTTIQVDGIFKNRLLSQIIYSRRQGSRFSSVEMLLFGCFQFAYFLFALMIIFGFFGYKSYVSGVIMTNPSALNQNSPNPEVLFQPTYSILDWIMLGTFILLGLSAVMSVFDNFCLYFRGIKPIASLISFLLRKTGLNTAPGWIDKYASNDWSISEENLIDWVK
jgi:hypothetical protein